MSKYKNVDLTSPFEAAVISSAALVTFIVNDKRYPPLPLKETPWLVSFADGKFSVQEEKGCLTPEADTILTRPIKDIASAEIGLVRKVRSAHSDDTAVVLRLEIFFRLEETLVLLCSDAAPAPEIIQALEKHSITVKDPFCLRDLFRNESEIPDAKLLEDLFLELTEKTGENKYREVYKVARGMKAGD